MPVDWDEGELGPVAGMLLAAALGLLCWLLFAYGVWLIWSAA